MRLLIIGASGVVGQLLCAELCKRPQLTVALAGRTVAPLTKVATTFNPAAAVYQCDVSQPATLDAALQAFQPDLVLNLSGNYTTTAMTVAEVCLAAKTMLFDICDEPKAMVALRGLQGRAVAAGVPMVIGGGTAPQTSCSLLHQVMEAAGPDVTLRMGYILGLNHYGPNAVQTVSRGISGLMSHDQPTDLWTVGPLMHFPPPFGPQKIRKYPVPETLLLDTWPGVKAWYAGARLSFGWLNAYLRLLQELGMTPWGVSRFWSSTVALICRGLFLSRCGADGIAVAIEAERDGRTVIGQLYHPEMSQLTAHALAVSIGLFEAQRPQPGVWWGHEVVDAASFLKQLESRGVVWQIQTT